MRPAEARLEGVDHDEQLHEVVVAPESRWTGPRIRRSRGRSHRWRRSSPRRKTRPPRSCPAGCPSPGRWLRPAAWLELPVKTLISFPCAIMCCTSSPFVSTLSVSRFTGSFPAWSLPAQSFLTCLAPGDGQLARGHVLGDGGAGGGVGPVPQPSPGTPGWCCSPRSTWSPMVVRYFLLPS